jgi:hypothetical protein
MIIDGDWLCCNLVNGLRVKKHKNSQTVLRDSTINWGRCHQGSPPVSYIKQIRQVCSRQLWPNMLLHVCRDEDLSANPSRAPVYCGSCIDFWAPQLMISAGTKVQKLNPETPLSSSCPICFNFASYIWSFWIKSLWIPSFLRYSSFCLLSFFLTLSLNRIDYQPAPILLSHRLQQKWSHLMPLINSTQPWHHNAISITTHDLIIVAQ